MNCKTIRVRLKQDPTASLMGQQGTVRVCCCEVSSVVKKVGIDRGLMYTIKMAIDARNRTRLRIKGTVGRSGWRQGHTGILVCVLQSVLLAKKTSNMMKNTHLIDELADMDELVRVEVESEFAIRKQKTMP